MPLKRNESLYLWNKSIAGTVPVRELVWSANESLISRTMTIPLPPYWHRETKIARLASTNEVLIFGTVQASHIQYHISVEHLAYSSDVTIQWMLSEGLGRGAYHLSNIMNIVSLPKLKQQHRYWKVCAMDVNRYIEYMFANTTNSVSQSESDQHEKRYWQRELPDHECGNKSIHNRFIIT